jgi:hypothetical protein
MINAAQLLIVLDSIAAGVDVADGAYSTINDAALDNRDLLASIDDPSVQEDLSPVFARRASLVKAATLYTSLQGAMINRAFDSHFGSGAGSLNAFLFANDLRVHPNLNKVGFQVDARSVFLPTVLDPVALYNGTGAGTGTFAAGSDIDTTHYGKASLLVEVDVMGNSARNLALTLKKYDGTTEIQNVTVPANSIDGFTVAIGGASDRYVGVQTISTLSGGTALDRLRVRSEIERVIAL